MTDWTAGYVADVGYTYGYYTELNPLRFRLPLLQKGIAFPNVGTACELGFGQGISTNIHAAASTTEWHGTDFNPSQAGFAQELAGATQANVRLLDESFEEFCHRQDLPDFDFIGLHGIWSWVTDANRQIVIDFVRRKLKVGGVLYISYNTLPGWSTFAPMRYLLTQHASILGSEGSGILDRIDNALGFAGKMMAVKPKYLATNLLVSERLEKMKGQDKQYLAHEYFNQVWDPLYFSQMTEWLEPAKLTFACSSTYLDLIDSVNLNSDQQRFLSEIPNAMLRETVRDFITNQQFRRDYWIRGARQITPMERMEKLEQQRIILCKNRDEISLKVTGALGEATMAEHIYNPILDVLADHKVWHVGELYQKVKAQRIEMSMLLQALTILIHTGSVYAAQDEAAISKAKKTCDKLNFNLMQRSRSVADISYLASPVTGGGIPIARFHQLFILAIKSGGKSVEDWANFTWHLLDIQGQKIIKDGKPLGSSDENLTELVRQATDFKSRILPIMKALHIV